MLRCWFSKSKSFVSNHPCFITGSSVILLGSLYHIQRRRTSGGFLPKMNHTEACQILNVSKLESLSAPTVHDCYQKLLARNHPDKGGSTYISAKINEAKNLLLKTLPGSLFE
ncbi:hypothetical protein GEMRC1_004592 [Eukaryota sp. GEM-RC1]